MGKSGRKKRAAHADGGLKPKPSEKLQHLLWYIKYGPKHPWLMVFLALLFLVPIAVSLIITNPSWFGGRETASVRTFKLTDFDDAELRQMVEESTGLKYDMGQDVTYVIDFHHSGELEPAYGEGRYVFYGGAPLVMINNSKCEEISQLSLQPWPDEPGYPREVLEAEIQKDLVQKLRQHPLLVADCIIRCLENEY